VAPRVSQESDAAFWRQPVTDRHCLNCNVPPPRRLNDEAAPRRLHRRLSLDSVYLRFFDFKNELSEKDLHYLTELDFDQRVALVATFGRVRGSR